MVSVLPDYINAVFHFLRIQTSLLNFALDIFPLRFLSKNKRRSISRISLIAFLRHHHNVIRIFTVFRPKTPSSHCSHSVKPASIKMYLSTIVIFLPSLLSLAFASFTCRGDGFSFEAGGTNVTKAINLACSHFKGPYGEYDNKNNCTEVENGYSITFKVSNYAVKNMTLTQQVCQDGFQDVIEHCKRGGGSYLESDEFFEMRSVLRCSFASVWLLIELQVRNVSWRLRISILVLPVIGVLGSENFLQCALALPTVRHECWCLQGVDQFHDEMSSGMDHAVKASFLKDL